MPLFAPWKRYQFFMRLKKKKKKREEEESKPKTVMRDPLPVIFESRSRMTAHLGGAIHPRDTSLVQRVSGHHTARYFPFSLSLSLSSCLSIIFSLGSCMLIQNGTKRITRVVVDTCSSLRLFVVIVVVVAAVVFVIIVVVPVVTSLPSSLPSSFSHPFLSLSLFNCDGCLGGHHELAGR